MSAIVVLSTDTPHHRYFLNTLERAGIPLRAYLFETTSVEPPFATGPVFEAQEHAHEMAHFFTEVPFEVDADKCRLVPRCGSSEGLAALDELQPDFGVVFGTGRLPASVIGRFRCGLINVHRGISGAYRGLDSDLWAIYHGDYRNIGVTVHRVDETLDTGEVVYQARLELRRGMRAWQLRYHTTVLATTLAQRALQDFLRGRLTSRPLAQRGRYYSFMPVELKRIVAGKFDSHCEALDA